MKIEKFIELHGRLLAHHQIETLKHIAMIFDARVFSREIEPGINGRNKAVIEFGTHDCKGSLTLFY